MTGLSYSFILYGNDKVLVVWLETEIKIRDRDAEFYLEPCLCSDEVKMYRKAALPSRAATVEMTRTGACAPNFGKCISTSPFFFAPLSTKSNITDYKSH